MKLTPALTWHDEDGEELDRRLLPLLDALVAHGSLAAAVEALGLSYRAAWGMLRSYEERLGAPLVVLERGRRARLAPAGQRLLDGQRKAVHRLRQEFTELSIDLAGKASLSPIRPAPVLRIVASHDIALATLRDAWRAVDLDLTFAGSTSALAVLQRDAADLAGFHVPLARAGQPRLLDVQPFRRMLDARRHRLVVFARREQGLMLGRRAARQVRRLSDLVTHGLAIVNRQPGSGTRLILDALLAREGIAPASLRGYAREEFTHRAVAATVAAGSADAALGLRAAAEEHDLAFLPLVTENYYLAVPASRLRRQPMIMLIEHLCSVAFAQMMRRIPGYDARDAGTVIDVSRM